MEFGVDQMNLPQIPLSGVAGHPRAMFDGFAEMRIAFNAEPRQQSDAVLVRLAHRVLGAAAYCDDHSVHRTLLRGCEEWLHGVTRASRRTLRMLFSMRGAFDG